jgi:hypothetical protein
MRLRAHFAWLMLAPTLCVAGTLSVTSTSFKTLGEQDQLQVLRSALHKRAEMLSNVCYKVHVENFIARYADQQIGDRQETISRYEQEFWKTFDGYRLKHAGYIGTEETPLFVSNSSFDAKNGSSRMLAEHSQVGFPQGRITSQHDNITKFNEYAGFLPGFRQGTQASHLQFLLDNFEEVQLLKGSPPDVVALRICMKPSSGGNDVRTFWLAPEKDFMVVRWEKRRDWQDGNRFQCADMWVADEIEVNSIWMPNVIMEAGWSERTQPGRNGVMQLSLQEIDIGSVSERDLWVDFPKGTEVIDDITQNVYVVGDPDRPIARVDMQALSGKRMWIGDIPWVIILDLVFVLAVFLLFKIRRRWARIRVA